MTALTVLLTWFGLSAVVAPVIGLVLFGRDHLPQAAAEPDRFPLVPVAH